MPRGKLWELLSPYSHSPTKSKTMTPWPVCATTQTSDSKQMPPPQSSSWFQYPQFGNLRAPPPGIIQSSPRITRTVPIYPGTLESFYLFSVWCLPSPTILPFFCQLGHGASSYLYHRLLGRKSFLLNSFMLFWALWMKLTKDRLMSIHRKMWLKEAVRIWAYVLSQWEEGKGSRALIGKKK